MRSRVRTIACWLASLALAATARAAEPGRTTGRVELPLEEYAGLVEGMRATRLAELPARYALGTGEVTVTVIEERGIPAAHVKVRVGLEILDDGFTVVPLLPAGTAVESVTVAGAAARLAALPEGLAWTARERGSYEVAIAYVVDGSRSAEGYLVAVPLPAAASMTLVATLPAADLDAAVIPGVASLVESVGSTTRVTATIPATRGLQLTWRVPTTADHVTDRAAYHGAVAVESAELSAELDVEVFSDGPVKPRLLPTSVTLKDLQVDGKAAPILVEGDRYTTLVRGRGAHRIHLGFEVAVTRDGGPPRLLVPIAPVPVSRFELELPGHKDLAVEPHATVALRTSGEATTATVFVPMTDRVTFSWTEAVPEEQRAEVRASATIFHAASVDEGVLAVGAAVVYDVTRGETSTLRLAVPAGVQVNRITSTTATVVDWRLGENEDGGAREATVFFDRPMGGEIRLEVQYDRSIGSGDEATLPLLEANGVSRRRGMVALLAGRDLVLEPRSDGGAARVGENQLPAFFKDALDAPVAHTFKYAEAVPEIVVAAAPPARAQGRFDVEIDTLLSIGEVTMRASASVDVNVKAGQIDELALRLPAGVNLLALTGPSIRAQEAQSAADGQRMVVAFTQPVDGQIRLEVNYEQILSDGDRGLVAPMVKVEGADVAQGRLALEALSAVEVRATKAEQLTALDAGELPRQLVLRTTNPILMAYKYVHADPPPVLVLEVTRHDLLSVQEAVIDSAEYRTLVTPDGLAVTTSDFLVRNSKKQFLRVALPRGATVWSVLVQGKPEKPALGDGGDDLGVLVKIVNSTRGFPVRIIYSEPQGRIAGLGTLHLRLPRPEILATQTRWDLYLPDDLRYGAPRTNLRLTSAPVREVLDGAAPVDAGVAAPEGGAEPLVIDVPATGVHLSFEKLYANQGEEPAWVDVTYASRGGTALGTLLSLLGTLAVLGGAGTGWRVRRWRLGGLAIACAGGALVVVPLVRYGVSAAPAFVLALGVVLLVGARVFRRRFNAPLGLPV